MKLTPTLAALALPFTMIATAAHAQDQPSTAQAADDQQKAEEEAAGPWDIEGEVTANSDYRFRGISLSDKDPELTASLTVSHKSGLYASAWGSNVNLDDANGDEFELDLTGGFSHDLGPVNLDVNAVYYLYPGHGGISYYELNASLGYSIGEGEVRAGFAYAPSQENIGDVSNRYYYVSADFPIKNTPASLHGSFGIEDGAFGDKKRDWLIGASYDLGSGFTATADYVDTARAYDPLGSATVVIRLGKTF